MTLLKGFPQDDVGNPCGFPQDIDFAQDDVVNYYAFAQYVVAHKIV